MGLYDLIAFEEKKRHELYSEQKNNRLITPMIIYTSN